ncbi:MAG: T9SS type A sorting domain-containing protein, partial [Bacteroidota bacterium]
KNYHSKSAEFLALSRCWDNASRRNYTYNVDDLLFIEDYAISSGPSTWLVFDQHSYIYDAQGRLIEDELQELNFSTMLLENKERWTYSFTGNLKDQDLLEEWNFANVWENDERKNYLYDSNNVLESIEERSWTVSDNWSDPYRRTLFYYNSDALISEVLQQNNVSDIWINNERVLNSYTNLNLTSILGQTWSNSMSVWENEYQILQSFDADDNMTEQIYQNWEISDWENFLRIVNYWSPEATLNIEFYNMDDLAAKIFPNPSHGFIHIDFNKVLLDKTSIELYTVSGQLMLKRQIEDNLDHITVPLENMESGVYFLNIRNANSKQVYKIIRQ